MSRTPPNVFEFLSCISYIFGEKEKYTSTLIGLTLTYPVNTQFHIIGDMRLERSHLFPYQRRMKLGEAAISVNCGWLYILRFKFASGSSPHFLERQSTTKPPSPPQCLFPPYIANIAALKNADNVCDAVRGLRIKVFRTAADVIHVSYPSCNHSTLLRGLHKARIDPLPAGAKPVSPYCADSLIWDMVTCAERLKSAVELVDRDTRALTHYVSMRGRVSLRGWVDFGDGQREKGLVMKWKDYSEPGLCEDIRHVVETAERLIELANNLVGLNESENIGESPGQIGLCRDDRAECRLVNLLYRKNIGL
ncbi:hypothetical protein K440DRAFT_679528 [Wilcoxina mikolae CBS 423.85]|nr:hypothetical protein K440DRAFT_679528 [Wilcoxina mikolae CBS 423.85]